MICVNSVWMTVQTGMADDDHATRLRYRRPLSTSREDVRRKKNPPLLDQVNFERFEEGLCAQIFHAGPYGEAERPTTDKLHAFITVQGFEKTGKHHEIYFNSPLRTAPEKLKTIIRQPICRAGTDAQKDF